MMTYLPHGAMCVLRRVVIIWIVLPLHERRLAALREQHARIDNVIDRKPLRTRKDVRLSARSLAPLMFTEPVAAAGSPAEPPPGRVALPRDRMASRHPGGALGQRASRLLHGPRMDRPWNGRDARSPSQSSLRTNNYR